MGGVKPYVRSDSIVIDYESKGGRRSEGRKKGGRRQRKVKGIWKMQRAL